MCILYIFSWHAKCNKITEMGLTHPFLAVLSTGTVTAVTDMHQSSSSSWLNVAFHKWWVTCPQWAELNMVLNQNLTPNLTCEDQQEKERKSIDVGCQSILIVTRKTERAVWVVASVTHSKLDQTRTATRHYVQYQIYLFLFNESFFYIWYWTKPVQNACFYFLHSNMTFQNV